MGDTTPALERSSRLTWANALTLTRLAAAPLCAWALATGHDAIALVLFSFAVASDFADGRLARRRRESSAFGGLLDHLSDATFVTLGLGACALRGLVPAFLPVLIALAFAQYTLDSRSLSGRPLRTSFLGRWNGIAYYVLLGVPVVRDGLGLGWPADSVVLSGGWALVLSTLVSMLDRGWALLRG
jgi:cardiolipin synthase